MSYKTYESYKDSGIEWISNIPINWELFKIKNIGSFLNGFGFPEKYQGNDEGETPFLKVSDINNPHECNVYKARNYVNSDIIKLMNWTKSPKNSIIFPKIGAALLKNHRKINKVQVIIDNNMCSLDCFNKFYYKYVYYIFKELDMADFDNQSTVPSINFDLLKNYKFPIPNNFNEQEQIVSYLDKKTSEIDENIAKNKELISLLEEKKTALINQVVTKGLDLNVPMKDSGIEWIGEIPEHWEIRKLKNISDIIMGQSPNSEDVNEDGNGVLFMQGNAEFGDTYPNPTSFCSNPKKLSRKGDILMSVRAPVGELNLSDKVYCIGRGLCSIKATNINSMYLWYFLSNSKLYFDFYSNGSTFDAITVDALSNLFINLPTKSEQEKFVSHLNKEISKYDEIIRNVEKQIDLLEEYKTSLIHHAVTGKIDVRDEI